MADAFSITCRRCGETYLDEPGRILKACPRCSASPLPLRHHLHHNGVSAILSAIAMVCLMVGMVLPFISMNKLGESRVYSLLGGIRELFYTGNIFIGGILLVFSVLFPVVKLLMLLAATSGLLPVTARGRRMLHGIAVFTGKYSLLDVLVVAVMIVLVKFRGIAEVQARPGTGVFGIAVLLSIAAGLCVKLDDSMKDESTNPNPTPPAPVRRAGVYFKLLWLLLGLGILAPGLWSYTNVPHGGEVEAIKLMTKQGIAGQAAEAVDNVDLSTPDLYLKIFTPAGETRLPTFKSTPIGNGLTWNLPARVALGDLQRIEVWDYRSILSDRQVDRITVDQWSLDGQRFHIDLLGRPNTPPTWALPTIAVGATLSVLALLRFIWDQVI